MSEMNDIEGMVAELIQENLPEMRSRDHARLCREQARAAFIRDMRPRVRRGSAMEHMIYGG